jgi:hypothetical protein
LVWILCVLEKFEINLNSTYYLFGPSTSKTRLFIYLENNALQVIFVGRVSINEITHQTRAYLFASFVFEFSRIISKHCVEYVCVCVFFFLEAIGMSSFQSNSQ